MFRLLFYKALSQVPLISPRFEVGIITVIPLYGGFHCDVETEKGEDLLKVLRSLRLKPRSLADLIAYFVPVTLLEKIMHPRGVV